MNVEADDARVILSLSCTMWLLGGVGLGRAGGVATGIA